MTAQIVDDDGGWWKINAVAKLEKATIGRYFGAC
jgi:hypothetical protein